MQAVFLESSQVIAVTADSRGRVLLHNVTQYLSLTAKLAGRLSKVHSPPPPPPLSFLTAIIS